jgi:hypothetical protein
MLRCYNGAWDSKATAIFAAQDAAMATIRKIEPEAHCTYFPSEGKFQVHVWGRPLSTLCDSQLAALNEAIGGFKCLNTNASQKTRYVKR